MTCVRLFHGPDPEQSATHKDRLPYGEGTPGILLWRVGGFSPRPSGENIGAKILTITADFTQGMGYFEWWGGFTLDIQAIEIERFACFSKPLEHGDVRDSIGEWSSGMLHKKAEFPRTFLHEAIRLLIVVYCPKALLPSQGQFVVND